MAPITVTAPPPAGLGVADTATEGDVSQQQIEMQPRYRVGEVLKTVPGLIITQHSGEGKANQYFLRGFNLDHGTDIDISLDDMPVNMRTHAHGQGYADLNFMIPELIGDLHYSKGPYFADLGDFDTAGAVQMTYVDTLPQDIASISAGTLNNYRGLAAMSRPWGAGNILVAAEYDHVDGPWVIPDNFNKGNLVARYSQGNADNGFSFTGMYMNDAFHATNQIPQRAVSEGLISNFGAIDPTDGGQSERYSLSAKYVSTIASICGTTSTISRRSRRRSAISSSRWIAAKFMAAMSATRYRQRSPASTRRTPSDFRPAPTTSASVSPRQQRKSSASPCATIT